MASSHTSKSQPKDATDKTDFLTDLGNYIALGSFTFHTSFRSELFLPFGGGNKDSEPWTEFHKMDYNDKDCPAYLAHILALRHWVRVYARRHQRDEALAVVRVYVLPDDVGRRYVDRDDGTLRKSLAKLVNKLDVSTDAWEGRNKPCEDPIECYNSESSDDDSLFYIFNTLLSPSPRPLPVSCIVSQEAIDTISNSFETPGLKTRLYPYQRRSVATMIKREVEPARALDPRLEPLKGPTGQGFFYDRETGALIRDRREYEEARGGILGESMGLGKTLICLATILVTKGHWPQIPPEYSLGLHPVRSQVGSLMQMSAAAVGRTQVPWRVLFQDFSRAGEDHKNCLNILEENIGSYVIPAPVARRSRRPSSTPKGKTVQLSTATLIIVPQNLLSQWKNEIALHVDDDGLQVLCLDSGDEVPIPSANKLLQYDLILLPRQRFERELVPSESAKTRSKVKGGCRCSLDEDCHCSRDDEYRSPLKDLHFLRIIMDEGHEFSASGRKNNTYWALRELHVDRKWIVSGTPASGLLGVEVGTATFEISDTMDNSRHKANWSVLEARRKESALSQERKDLEMLGHIVAGFLKLKPWANSKDEDPASWQKYIMPHDSGRRKVRSLKTLLESLVIRHRIEDVEADIQLPALHNRVVYLQPGWHDKLSINLFILSLAVNAVTSERTDEDYMFHAKNRRQLNLLISNLRQSGFYWTSFSPEDIAKTIRVSRLYLDEHTTPELCKEEDRTLLETAISVGEVVLKSTSWRSFADLHEMGIFVEGFPEDAYQSWSLTSTQEVGSGPLLVGATQMIKAQRWTDSHLYATNPAHGLAGVGTSTMQKLRQVAVCKTESEGLRADDSYVEARQGKNLKKKKAVLGLTAAPKLTEKQTVSRAKIGSSPRKTDWAPALPQPTNGSSGGKPLKSALKSALKRFVPKEPVELLPSDSPLAQTKICGTASAKLSYLLDRVTALHHDEKILIFYEGDHIAYYIAQAFDLVDIRYLIYTQTLSLSRQNAYITTFNTTETFRVLLMNVHQAALGLHIASASRVFFVNPVWQPNVEAQAIKRAHRIGQTRPVYVETLVLKDTLEDQMLRRRKGMTAQEHQKAEKSLLDDDTMSTIIKNAQFIPLLHEDICDVSKQIAKLSNPQQLFGRVGKGDGDIDDPDADLVFPVDTPRSKKASRKRKNDSEYVMEMNGLPPPRRRFSDARLPNGQGAEAWAFSVTNPATVPAITVPENRAHVAMSTADSGVSNSSRNLGFDLGSYDQSTSLFGANVPASSLSLLP